MVERTKCFAGYTDTSIPDVSLARTVETRIRREMHASLKEVIMKDPVCGMDVNEHTSQWISTYEGRTYAFCSAGCKESFDKTPGKYLRETDLLGRKLKK